MKKSNTLSEYDYHLPEEYIAQSPHDPPHECNMLIHDRITWNNTDVIFRDLVKEIDLNTLMVFNNSKVVKARIIFPPPVKKIRKWDGPGKQLEIFYLRSHDAYSFDAMVWAAKYFKVGTKIYLREDIWFHVDKIILEWRQLTCNKPILDILESVGQMPLPPYISYTKDKEAPYQSMFAQQQGSVAAPTASLHFTPELMTQLEKKWITIATTTLHIGLGTFKTVEEENISNHKIHAERIQLSQELFTKLSDARTSGKKILAVGTTVTRTLESLPYLYTLLDRTDPYRDELCTWISPEDAWVYIKNLSLNDWNISFDSSLYITPGFRFRLIDELITNFHLPKSSLLMLVAAFMWLESMQEAYQHAMSSLYRFYSFGDAMWIR